MLCIRRSDAGVTMRTISAIFLVLFITVTSVHSSDVKKNSNSLVGQWIWSTTDEKIFIETRKSLPDLVPCIWVSTIAASRGKVSQRLAISPALAKSVSPAAIIVRIEDSLHELWNTRPPEETANDIDSRLSKLMELLAAAGIDVEEVQLDYDCPVRQLNTWAGVVRTVAACSLRGKRVWITSLPAHLAESKYRTWFQNIASGHILQLFDTGVLCNQETLQMFSDRLRMQGMPFRIGLGAFERVHSAKTTNHQLWFSALSAFTEIPGYQGVWVFPGGRKWLNLYPLRITN
jgi:hypothetical protein